MSRILYTCHEGCNPKIWEWCGPGIRDFASQNNAKLVVLPKSKLRNPQWVLFDAMRDSLNKHSEDEFAWVDSDIVVREGATDIWAEYPEPLTLCRHPHRLSGDLLHQLGLPPITGNICTGVVRWSRNAAAQIIDWFDSNADRLPKIKVNRMGDLGDQEVLVLALHHTHTPFSLFHKQMHVAGSNPPAKTAFKHKGGGAKMRDIPRFLKMNEDYIDPYSTHLEVLRKHSKGVAVEFGCGLFSTPRLLDQCDSLMSVEMQDPEWLTKVKDVVGNNPKWSPVESIGGFGFQDLEYPKNIDLGFVDGHGASRYTCVNFLMQLGVPTIVAHDTEARNYQWGLVDAAGYTEVVHKELEPWTTVWSKIS